MHRGMWHPDSWRKRPSAQQPNYSDAAALEHALERIRAFPPLVVPGEIEKLKECLREAGRGNAFILQAGNCAERFSDCNDRTILNQLKILLQMSVILTYGVRKAVVRIGRIAGQYAKPRSKEYETIKGARIPAYRGDSVNAPEPSLKARTPDPQRLLASYYHSAITLNHIRSLIDGGFADLHNPHNWDLETIGKSRNWSQYEDVVNRILDAIQFMESFDGARSSALGRIDFFTSHEGLLLNYEEALTRKAPTTQRTYNLGAHTLWIGNRTRDIKGAHVEYFRGLANPIGVKVGPDLGPDELVELIHALNPDNEEGRLTLITRMGLERIGDALPSLAKAVRRAKRHVIWSCDPMHGNTLLVNGGVKTRDFGVALEEVKQAFRIHRENRSRLAGVHFELTGEDVTECIGGGGELTSQDLADRYETACDPRLNYSQSLEMAFLIADLLKNA
jgi:3-deoxy-7-phosphoheptulonate synthase